MLSDMNGLCHLHSFSVAQAVCHRCGHTFCEECTVHPFGARKPLCKDCAMVIGGVRPHAQRPAQPKRVIRQRVRALRRLREHGDQPQLVSTFDTLAWPGSGPTEDGTPAPPGSTPEPAMAPSVGSEPDPFPGPAMVPAGPSVDPGAGVAPPIDWSRPFG